MSTRYVVTFTDATVRPATREDLAPHLARLALSPEDAP